jgi:hypothetical protein
MYRIINASHATLSVAVANLESKMVAAIEKGFRPEGSPVIVQNGATWTVGQAVWCVALPSVGAQPD